MKFSFRRVLLSVAVVFVAGLASSVGAFAVEEAGNADQSQAGVAARPESDFVANLEGMVAGLNPADPNSLNDANNKLVHGGVVDGLRQDKDQSGLKKIFEEKGFSNQDVVNEEMKNGGFLKAIIKLNFDNIDLAWVSLCDGENNEQLKKMLDGQGQPRTDLKADIVNAANGDVILSNDLLVRRDKGEGWSDVAIIVPGFVPKGKLSNDSKLRLNVVDKNNNEVVEAFEINAQLKPIKK